MDKTQVSSFVSANMFPITATNLQSRCVDGRPAVDENTDRIPAISKPGGDIGDLMIAFGALNNLGLKLAPEKVLEVVSANIGGLNNLKFHTDSKAEGNGIGTGMGCGHINKASADPADYLLDQQQIDFLHQALPGLLNEGAKQVVLDGDHDEKAVLVINSDSFGVKPYSSDGDKQTQVFVYQQTKHSQQLDQLAHLLTTALNESGESVQESVIRKALGDAFDKQLNATLSRIAQGLPIYEVQIDQPGQIKVNALS